VLGAAVSLAGAARPSFWYDEAATISASYSRPLSELWQMLGHVDAVHGLYYLLMHGWFAVAPPTEFWARVPSGLAVGAAAAGLVVLGTRLASLGTGVVAGVLLAVLPRATWAGVEARPYALTMALAVWLTVALTWALNRQTRWAWLGYGALLTVSVVFDVFLALLAFAHVCYVAVTRRPARGFWVSATAALVLTAPFVALVARQARQISWVGPISGRTIEDVAVQQYFDRNPYFALLAALLLVVAARRLGAVRESVVLAVAWMVVPTAVIIVYSLLAEPLYTPRYLCFTAPAVALLLGLCVVAVTRAPWQAVAVVAAFAVAATHSYVAAQRSTYAKYGMDYSRVADVIAAHASPGDCLLVNDTVTFHPAPLRPLLAARPQSFRPLVDVSLWQRATDIDAVFDTNLVPEASVGPLQHCATVWVLTQADPQAPGHETGVAIPPGPLFGGTTAFAVTRDLGFRLVERWQCSLVQVIKAIR
jgi:mannosyltransferase